MSAWSVTAYLSPTILRKRATNSGGSGGAGDWTIFILVSCVASFPRRGGAAQPVIDRFAKPVMWHRHHRDGMRALGVEAAKITEKIGGGLIEIAARRQIQHRSRRVNTRYRNRAKRQQRLAGLDVTCIEPHLRARRV